MVLLFLIKKGFLLHKSILNLWKAQQKYSLKERYKKTERLYQLMRTLVVEVYRLKNKVLYQLKKLLLKKLVHYKFPLQA